MSLSKSPKSIIAGVIIVGVAATAWIVYKKRSAQKDEQLAELADVRSCGADLKDQKAEGAQLKKWLANETELQSEGKQALLRNLSALPPQVIKTLESRNIRFAWESLRSGLTCAPSGAGANVGLRFSCLKSTSNYGDVMIFGSDPGTGADGKPLPPNEREIIDGRMLPLVFWSLFEQIWNTAEERDLVADNARSRSNDFSRLKRHVSEALTIGPGEQEFYRREFGGAGTRSPAFDTRATVLMAANLYCDADTYARLQKQQPEAVKRFMSSFGCALGRPWHLGEADYNSYCL